MIGNPGLVSLGFIDLEISYVLRLLSSWIICIFLLFAIYLFLLERMFDNFFVVFS